MKECSTMSDHWGYHTILDASGCDAERIRSAENITEFAKALVKKIDMVAFGEPQVQHFGSDDKAGYTLIQLIETSNITAHFVEENNTMYLDVFSCKPYDPQDVVNISEEFFKFAKYKTAFLERQAEGE